MTGQAANKVFAFIATGDAQERFYREPHICKGA